MKKIKTILGIKTIEETGQDQVLAKAKEILNEIRATLVSRIIANLPTYIDYKFHQKASQRQNESIKNALLNIQSSSVEPIHYKRLLEEILELDSVYVGTALFYKEIDENISWYLHETNFKLAV